MKLPVTGIDGNLLRTRTGAWAVFVLGAQRWQFRGDAARTALVTSTGRAYAALTGRDVHLRQTVRPYPVDEWAADLAERSPDATAAFSSHLDRARRYLAGDSFAEKQTFLLVGLATPGAVDRVAARWRKAPVVDSARDAQLVTDALSDDPSFARPATQAEVEWLLYRSTGLGLPAPGALLGGSREPWDAEDMAAFADVVEYEASPLSRTVRITGRATGMDVTRHVAVLALGRMPELEVPETSRPPWATTHDDLGFPVELSVRARVLTGPAASSDMTKRRLLIRDQQKHYAEHDLDEPLDLARRAAHSREAEDEMDTGDDLAATRVHGWWRLAVAGRTAEECLERCRQVIAVYAARKVAVHHPPGQLGLVREFIPGGAVSSVAYKRRLPVLYAAAAMPTVTSQVGDRRGPLLARTTSGGSPVTFDTRYGMEHAEASGLVPVVANMGGGKSVLMGAVADDALLRGIRTTALDPANTLVEGLWRLHGGTQLDLLSGPSGRLCPYRAVPEPPVELDDYAEQVARAEAKRVGLARDVCRMLIDPAFRGLPLTELALTAAVTAVGGARKESLWAVTDALDDPQDADEEMRRHSRRLGRHLRDKFRLPYADRFTANAGDLNEDDDPLFLGLTMRGLVRPRPGVAEAQWTDDERMAAPLLLLAAYYATHRIYGRPRLEPKVFVFDETRAFGETAAGEALFSGLTFDSRKWMTRVLAGSQLPTHVLRMDAGSQAGAAFVGRITDEQTAGEALRLLGVERGVGYEQTLMGLPTGRDVPYRDFVMRDDDGRVERVRLDLAHRPELLRQLDTTGAR